MYEFFVYKPSTNPKFDDLRAPEFTKTEIDYKFTHWTQDIQEHMNKQLMHVSRDRIKRTQVMGGCDETQLFLEDFERAWTLFLENLQDLYKTEFEEEIAAKESSEFGRFNLRGI